MSRQDKATTERHARTLRELVKQPGNKLCGDCKRQDARWASWNIGIFICIRCSGIHRSMGTHISKVKSVDLDTWTPEQMANIMKWGNQRANAYWEANLKAGHAPPDHKIDSFIRSKYETRRWAMDGPVPEDPSVLDEVDDSAPEPAAAPSAAPPPPSRPTTVSPAQAAPPVRTTASTATQLQGRQLLSTGLAGRTPQAAATPAQPAQAAPAASAPAPAAPQNDIFSLDFHAPAAGTPAAGQAAASVHPKDKKQDILSLFSKPAAAPAAAQPGAYAQSAAFGTYGAGAPVQASPWGDAFGAAPQQQQPAQPATQSMMGNAGVGMWGANSGWTQPAPAQPAQPNIWGAPGPSPGTQSLFNTNDVWASGGAAAGGQAAGGNASDPWGSFGNANPAPAQPKKDDAFGDIWGSFK